MQRRIFLLAGAGASLIRADTREALIELFGSMAGALSEGNAAAFLRAIDPSMSGYGEFAGNVRALIAQNSLSSSIEILKQDGDDNKQSVELDWLLEITKGSILRRQGVVKFRLELRKKQWRIIDLDPRDFFAPPAQ